MARVFSRTVRALRQWLMGGVAFLLALVLLGTVIVSVRDAELGWLSPLALLAGGFVAIVLTAWRGQTFERWLRRIRQRRRPYLTPFELPPPPRLFIGRDRDIEHIQQHLLGEPSGERRLVTVHGDAGIGKTTVALHVAHRVADAFPHGQLFARVALTEASAERTHAERVDLVVNEVLSGFVTALQGPADRLPTRAEARARRYRELTRERQVLVVLDDADDVTVVNALLPAGPGCAAIVTSRRALVGLATPPLEIPLGPLGQSDALQVIRTIAGERVDDEPQNAEKVLEVTDLHPLSVRIAATALAASPYTTLGDAVDRMHAVRPIGRRRRITHAGALDLTYGLLTAEEQRALRRIGLLSRSQFAAWMLGELMGPDVDDRKAARIADRLVHVGLLERTREESAGVPMFTVPEHVLSYAKSRRYERTGEQQQSDRLLKALRSRQRERAGGTRGPTEADIDRRVLIPLQSGRIYDALGAARDLLALARDTKDAASIAHARSAFAEVRTEVGSFEAAVDLAHATISDPAAPALARAQALRCLGRLHRHHRQLESGERRLRQAVSAAVSAGDRLEHIRALRELAIIQSQGRAPHKAINTVERALAMCPEKGDRERPGTLLVAGIVRLAAGRHQEAADLLDTARRQARQHRQALVEAWTVYQEARLRLARGEPGKARDSAFAALELFAKMNHRYGKAHCRLIVGDSYLAEDRSADAVPVLEEALENFGSCGDRWAEGRAAYLLAIAHQQEGRRGAADGLFLMAAGNFEDVGDLASVRRTLNQLESPAAQSGGQLPRNAPGDDASLASVDR